MQETSYKQGYSPTSLPNEEPNQRLTIRELFFLAFILSFGFCGFTVCVDRIYKKSHVADTHKSSDTQLTAGMEMYDLSYQEDYSVEN